MKLNFSFKIRQTLFWLHLALGVLAGLVVLVLSATGAVLVLQRPITSLVDRDLRRLSSSEQAPVSIERLMREAGASLPASPTALTLYADPAEASVLALGRAGVVYVDPRSGRVIGEGSRRARGFFRGVEDWHRWLAATGEWRAAGRAVTGASTLAFLALTLSGPLLWWPRRWSRAALAPIALFRRGLRGRARDFNWHNVIGIWAAVPLALIAATGVVIAFDWANALVFRLAGEAAPVRAGGPPPDARPGRDRDAPPRPSSTDGLDALWARAQSQVEGWRSITVRLPLPSKGPVTFTIDRGTGTRPDLRAQLVLDRTTGDIVRWEPYASQSRGRRWRTWVRWTHTGEAGGVVGQAIAAVASAGAMVLAGTGLALTWRRLRAWAGRRATAPAAGTLGPGAPEALGDNA